MGNKNGGIDKPDGIERITNALFTGLIGIVLLCALLPILISQVADLSNNAVLEGWAGLSGFQDLIYLIPVVFGIGLIIVIIRFFSSSRE